MLIPTLLLICSNSVLEFFLNNYWAWIVEWKVSALSLNKYVLYRENSVSFEKPNVLVEYWAISAILR